ncbi:hypothetical protein, partial [Campylobacter hyointestinalis]|uniref:hypothetical protein n=1 Tax=Campylobacter hyointestinalis TaxID=198 RepID=UPI000D438F61
MSSDVFNSTSVIETSKVLRLVDTGAEKLVDVGNSRLTFVAEPKDSKDAVNKEHFDTNLSEYKKNIDEELQEAKSEFNTLYANAVDEFNALHRDADIKMTNINEGLADYTLKKQDFDIKVDETNQKLDTNLAQSNDIKTHIENRYNEIEVLKNETNSNLEQVRELKNDSDTKIADISSKIDLANADLAEFNEAKDGLGYIKQTIKELREVVDNGLIDDENLSTLKSYSSNKVDVTFAKKTEVIAKSQEIETQIQELETRTQSIIDEKLGLKLDTNIYSVDKATFATKEELNTKTEELTNSLNSKTEELTNSLNSKTEELTNSLNTKTEELTNILNEGLNTKEDKGVAKTLDDALKLEIAGNYLLKTEVATDSDKLDGRPANEYALKSEWNSFIPYNRIKIADIRVSGIKIV